ncbi:MAG: glycosyltransferase family 4 protein [Bacteroidales bacterium]|nr:glycosyltransferase family 4 protein [Bacteroidales bacterium]
MKKKLFIVVNQDKFFLSHRLPIGNAAKDAGYDVTIVSEDTGVSNKIRENGLKTIALPIDKAGTNIISELKTFFFLYKLFKREKVDVVHLVGLKVMLWGSLACNSLGIHNVVSSVSGLGMLFYEQNSKSFISKSILKLLRFTHKNKKIKVIFQNNDNKAIFLRENVVKASQCKFTNGSGIDLNVYNYFIEPNSEPIKIVFTGRMIEDKGVLDLVEAANILKSEYYDKVQFLLSGDLDKNRPNAITEDILVSKCDGKYIKWIGFSKDVLSLLKGSHIMVFPSYHEGLPKSIIEAEAIGRPIVTTDSVGCRDTVIDGENGFLVPIKDPDSLAKALKKLIDDKDLRILMGKKSRELAVKRYDINDVIKVHLDIYKSFE